MKKASALKYLSASVIFIFYLIGVLHGQTKTIVQGQIKQSNGELLTNSAVYAIQYNPETKKKIYLDTVFTNNLGKYEIETPLPCVLLAIPNIIFENELPTYYGSTQFIQKANALTTDSNTPITLDFYTLSKNKLSSGTGSIGGKIKQDITPCRGVCIFLYNKEEKPVAFMTSNPDGNFLFKELPLSTYQVWVDMPEVDNSTTDIIELTSMNPEKNNLNFKIDGGSLMWVENNYNGIKDALINEQHVYTLKLNSLQHDVADKSLISLPDGTKELIRQIGEFINLESLIIDINRVSTLPEEIGDLTKLTFLSASLNNLPSLPNTMQNMRHLNTLLLEKNNFNKFPEVITKMPNLEVLGFQSNPIYELPPSIGDMKNLKQLDLSNCFELITLPSQIGDLEKLEELNLTNCVKLKILPQEMRKLKNLRQLDVSGTKISVKELHKNLPSCEIRKD